MTTERTVLLAGQLVQAHGDYLAAQLTTSWRIAYWTDDDGPERFARLIGDADALVTGSFQESLPSAPRLALLQLPFTGYDWLKPAMLPAGCVAANAYGHESAIAEYVMAAILEWQIGLAAKAADFKAGNWRYKGPPNGPFHEEVAGCHLGLIGYGHIGREVAKRAQAFGMTLSAVTRRPRPTPDGLAALGAGDDAIDHLLGQADFVVVACPLSDHTRGLIDRRRIALLKPTAVLINVARAEIVDTAALFEALRDRSIGGAVIDVWSRYPRQGESLFSELAPADQPFWDLDNVVMTPHRATWTRAHLERRWQFVAANLDRLAQGEALQNVIEI
jgi:phosphoglycerate dehydrogenase-like enzyme